MISLPSSRQDAAIRKAAAKLVLHSGYPAELEELCDAVEAYRDRCVALALEEAAKAAAATAGEVIAQRPREAGSIVSFEIFKAIRALRPKE